VSNPDQAAPLRRAQIDAPIELSVEELDADATLRSQPARLFGQMAMWNAAIGGEEYDVAGEVGLSIAGMRKRLAEAAPTFLENVDTIVREDRLDESFVDAVCAPPRSSRTAG
jgi:AraC family transcriptional regulator